MIKLLFIIILTFLLTGCSKEKISLEDQYFVINITHRNDGERYVDVSHFYLLNEKGKILLDLSDTLMVCALSPGGKLISSYYVDMYPKGTLLVLQQMQENGQGLALLYNTATGELIKEECDHSISPVFWECQPTYIQINDKYYIVDEGFKVAPKDFTPESNVFQVGDYTWSYDVETNLFTIKDTANDVVNTVFTTAISFPDTGTLVSLKNKDDFHSIVNADGTTYLDCETFNELNKNCNIPTSLGVNITDRPSKDLIVVRSAYMSDDGTNEVQYEQYLCNMDGYILFPEIQYNRVDRAGILHETSVDYLMLYNKNDVLKATYYHIPTNALMPLPTGYESYKYAGNDFFLLINGNECTIYDAKNEIIGDTVQAEKPKSIIPLGANNYYIPHLEQFEYDGKVYTASKDHMTPYTNYQYFGNKTCIYIPTSEDRGWISFVFDRDGQLLLQTNQRILWLDDNHYITELNNGFELYSIEEKLLKAVDDVEP